MSDFKNVLKAGFLITASLLATGCGDDNKDNPSSNGSNNGGSNGGGSAPVNPTPSKPFQHVETHKFDLPAVLRSFNDSGNTNPVFHLLKKDEYKDYHVFTKGKLSAKREKAEPTSASPSASNIISLDVSNLKKPSTFILDSSELTKVAEDADAEVGGIIFAGSRDADSKAVVKGNIDTSLLVLRNSVITVVDKDASLKASYAHIGVDSAVGYEFPRQDPAGNKLTVPENISSEPKETANLALFGSASHSNATTKNSVNIKDTTVQGKTVATVAKQHDAPQNTLKLVTRSVSDKFQEILNKGGLEATDEKMREYATVDVGGRINTLDSQYTNVYSITKYPIELERPAALKAHETTGKRVTPTEHAKKSNSLELSNPFSKSKATQNNVEAHQAEVSKKPTVGMELVAHEKNQPKFTYQIKEGFYPEIGTWYVGENTRYNVIALNPLVVHNLNLNADLKLNILVEEHTFTKLEKKGEAEPIKALELSDQELFEALGKDYGITGIEMSDADTGGSEPKPHAHFDSHTPFPLWVVGGANSSTNKLVLDQLTMKPDARLDDGVYVMPLARDFSEMLKDSESSESIIIDPTKVITSWKIRGNNVFDKVLLIEFVNRTPPSLSAGTLNSVLMSSKAQRGHSVHSSQLDAVVAKLEPTNIVSTSFANVGSARVNQASQFAALARGVNVATAEKLGAVEQYAVSFNHDGVQFGLTYNLDGGNAFTSKSGTTSFGANVATNVLGMKAIVSAEASVDAAKNTFVNASLASYNAGLTFAKAYNAAGLSVVPMAGFGVSSNALNGYSAVVPMANGLLGLSMNDVSFSAATYHAGVNVALDDFVAKASGMNASLTLGVAGYLAANANAKLSTSEGVATNIAFEGSSATPYAQFSLGLASGETVNAVISTGSVAVKFGFDR